MTLGNLTFLSLVSLQGKMEIRMIIPIQWSLGEDKRRSISEAGEWQARLSSFSCVWLCATLGTIVHQAPLSMGFSRQEYWAELPCPPPGNLPNPGIEPTSLVSPSWAGVFFSSLETWKPECLRGLGNWEESTYLKVRLWWRDTWNRTEASRESRSGREPGLECKQCLGGWW